MKLPLAFRVTVPLAGLVSLTAVKGRPPGLTSLPRTPGAEMVVGSPAEIV